MNLYQIFLPQDQKKLKLWKERASDLAGGFTQFNAAQGLWLNPNGELVRDFMVPFTVACEPVLWRKLVDFAFECFPNEQAIFHAQLGEATIEFRP